MTLDHQENHVRRNIQNSQSFSKQNSFLLEIEDKRPKIMRGFGETIVVMTSAEIFAKNIFPDGETLKPTR